MSKPFRRLSVHELVDPLLRAGDIDTRIYNLETMKMGSLLHASHQKKQGKDYLSEYPLDGVVETEVGDIALSGRADGIIEGGPLPIIDEIKSTVAPLEVFFKEQREWHLGQALCYAYLYLKSKKNKTGASIRLSYISQVSSEKMNKTFDFTFEEIEETVKGYVRTYYERMALRFQRIEERDQSVKNLPFPYEEFRQGQRDLSQLVYGIAKKGGILFAEAPTGIGKTISTLYPSVLSFDEKRVERIFYLTAKNTGGTAAYQALGDLYAKGFKGRDSFLYSKEKICLCPGHACNPDDCPFAKGYYSKVQKALEEAVLTKERYDFETVVSLARKYGLCSFEFQLDLSLFADVIIADYNYFFDPLVYLERYFDEGKDVSKTLVLIDEAHNLVDRGRMMYSSSLQEWDLYLAKKALKGKEFTTFRKQLALLEKAFEGLADEELTPLTEIPETFGGVFLALKKAENKYWKSHHESLPKAYVNFRRELSRFLRFKTDFYGPEYAMYAYRQNEKVVLNLDCLDASRFLSECLYRARGAILFSATLSPVTYYMKAITSKDDHPFVMLPSPFPKENFKKLVAPKVSVRYKDRERSYEEVAAYLKAFVEAKVGNYFLYFPSYAYLQNLRPYLDFPYCNVLTQDRKMSEEEKLDFLDAFEANPKKTTIGLLILGGAFSEGVDLPDDRLIGVGIVGVGLPMVCYENDRIKEYFEEKEGQGFNFAYKFPGINKVTQAVGRVIRSATDIGSCLLIDDRYLRNDYRPLLERLWPDYQTIFSPEEVKKALSSFYKKDGD